MRKLLLTAATLVAVLATSCSGSGSDARADRGASPSAPSGAIESPGLEPISLLQQADSCDALLERIQDSVRPHVGPYGLDGYGYGPPTSWATRTSAADTFNRDIALQTAAAAPEASYSGTNVQEAGVDEADIIETDGHRILALVGSRLVYVDIDGPMERRGSVDLGMSDLDGADMFLDGDRVLVAQTGRRVFPSLPTRRGPWLDDTSWSGAPDRPVTKVSVIDLSDPDALEVTDAFRIRGAFQSARMVDGIARVVVATDPDTLEFLVPQSAEGEEAATEYNRKVVDESELDDWLPTIRQDGKDRRAGGCDQVYVPKRFAGAGMINVLTVPLADRLEPDTVSVQGSSQVVYASQDGLYVAAPSWVDPPEPGSETETETEPDRNVPAVPPTTTDVHRFSLAEPETATYEVSGRVDGTVMGQFALSEDDGFLRVATTEGPQWGWDEQSASSITVLHEQDGQLVRRGKVGDMGRGERITSVRFDGERAYVVTFRQVDPFYVVDLSDPAHPAVAGELKLPGFSSYLHPIGDGLVLGLGQGGTGSDGTKVSLFDASDPAAPTEVGQWSQPGGYSPAEEDHHAFLWWPETRQVVVPLTSSGNDGAVVLHVGDGTISETGRVPQVGVLRSVVSGDRLYTYSGFGLVSTDLATSGDRVSIPWT